MTILNAHLLSMLDFKAISNDTTLEMKDLLPRVEDLEEGPWSSILTSLMLLIQPADQRGTRRKLSKRGPWQRS